MAAGNTLRAAITEVVVSIAVFAGCEAATGGIGTVGCAAAAGAAGSLAGQAVQCARNGGDCDASSAAESAVDGTGAADSTAHSHTADIHNAATAAVGTEAGRTRPAGTAGDAAPNAVTGTEAGDAAPEATVVEI